MAKFAIVDSNNKVTNIIIADSIEEASVLGITVEILPGMNGGIGFIYNPETQTFVSPILNEEELNA